VPLPTVTWGIAGKNAAGKSCMTEISLNPKIVFNSIQPDIETLQKMQKISHDHCFIANTLNAKININILVL